MRRFVVVCFAAGLMIGLAGAQEPTPVKPAGKRTLFDPNHVQVHFRDGSHLKMVLLVESIEMMTKYGKVSVPIIDMRRIDFGLRIPSATLTRAESAMALLNDPKRGDAAKNDLLQSGEFAVPLLRQAARRPHAVSERALLEELKQRLPSDQFEARLYDTIHAAEFPVTGRVEAAAFKAKSPYFGDVLLRLDEVRTIRWLAAPERDELVVDAAKHGTMSQLWLDTGIDLSGESVRIIASGMIDLYPLGGEKGVYMATPNGNARVGRQTAFPAGALIGRIGNDGKPFLVGERYEGTPARGRLYLRIEIGPWQVQPLGSYTVRVTTDL